MTDVFSAAIVGGGRIAGLADKPAEGGPVRTHAQAYVRHPRFRLDAVVDPDPERRERFRSVWRVPNTYASLDELLTAGVPDAVSICSVTSEHYPQLLKVIEHGGIRAVLAEKPVCEQPQQLQALLDLHATRPDVYVLVNHSRRFDPAHQRVAADIRAGRFGTLVSGRCDYYGGWLHNGTHLVDTLRMLVGELRVVAAQPGPPARPGDPCLDVRILAGDAPIDLYGFDERHYQLFEIDLRFTEGRVLARNFGEEIIIEKVTTNAIDERYLAPVEESPLRGLDQPLLDAVDAMARSLVNEPAGCAPTLQETAITMRVLWEAMEQR